MWLDHRTSSRTGNQLVFSPVDHTIKLGRQELNVFMSAVPCMAASHRDVAQLVEGRGKDIYFLTSSVAGSNPAIPNRKPNAVIGFSPFAPSIELKKGGLRCPPGVYDTNYDTDFHEAFKIKGL